MPKFLKNLRHTNKFILLVSIALFLFGLVMVFSASNISAVMRYGESPYYYAIRQGLFLIVGLIGFFFIINIDTKNYGKYAWLGVLGCIGLLLFAYLYGPVINDSKGWINLGIINIQPGELVKVIEIVWIATFFELKKLALNQPGPSIFMFFMIAVMAGLVVIANDYGTAIIILAIAGIMYLLVPIRPKVKYGLVLAAIVVILIVVPFYALFNTAKLQRQLGRFQNFGNPCSEEKFYNEGNQVCNSIIAFNNGGVFGKGLGNSTQKYLYLPDCHTDFIFAIVVEETGLFGGTIVILAFMTLIFLVIRVGVRAKTFHGSMICYGTAIYIFLHIAVNIGGISGAIPLTGVPLPFISYGGTFTICLVGALSMVQRVEIETRTSTTETKTVKPVPKKEKK